MKTGYSRKRKRAVHMENVVMQEELSGQMTQEELLEQVNQAIFNIAVGGQSYRLG